MGRDERVHDAGPENRIPLASDQEAGQKQARHRAQAGRSNSTLRNVDVGPTDVDGEHCCGFDGPAMPRQATPCHATPRLPIHTPHNQRNVWLARGVDHYRKYCTRNIFLRGILWNTPGILGICSTIFPKFDPKWGNICQVDLIFWNFEEYRLHSLEFGVRGI